MSPASNTLWEWLAGIQPDERFALCAVLVVFGTVALIFIVAIIGQAVRSIYQGRLEDTLKRDLLDRGLAAEEITKILAAPFTTPHLKPTRHGRSAPKESGHVLVE